MEMVVVGRVWVPGGRFLGRRRRVVEGILREEAIQGKGKRLEGVKVGEVGISQGEALVDGLIEESTAFAAQSEGGGIVKLGRGAAAHGIGN